MKKNIKALCMVLLLFTGAACKRESLFKEDLAGFDPNSDLAVYEVQLTGPGQSSGEIYLDLSTGKLYTYADAVKQPERIDLIMLWGSATGSNLISPNDIPALQQWTVGAQINAEWFVKNDTRFIRLEQSAAGLELYDNVKSMADVEAAYGALKTLVENQSSYNVDLHGEGTALQQVGVGDVIGVKTSKNVYAIGKVQSIATGNSGNLRVSFKLDKRNEVEIEPLPPSEYMTQFEITADQLSTLGGANVIDLASGQQLSIQQGYYNQNNVDAIVYRDGAGITIASLSSNIPILGETTMEIDSDWEVRNETRLIRLKASEQTTSLFNQTFTNTLVREAFENGEDIVRSYSDYNQNTYGPGLSVRGLAAGDVVLYHSVDRDVYGMIRITDVGTNYVDGQVKANTYSRNEVAAPVLKEFTSTGAGSTTAAYIDFKTGTVYTTEAEAQANAANIDIVSVRGSSTGHNLFPLTHGGALGAWSGTWRTRVEAWPVRNAAELYGFMGADTPPQWWQLYHELKEDATMWDAFQTATAGMTSIQRWQEKSSSLPTSFNRNVIFIHSIDRKLLIALKIVESSTATAVTYRYKVVEL